MKVGERAKEALRAKARARANRRKRTESGSSETTITYHQTEEESDGTAKTNIMCINVKEEPEEGNREEGGEASTSTHRRGFSFAEGSSDQWQALPPIGELHQFIFELKKNTPWNEKNIQQACIQHYGFQHPFLRDQLHTQVEALLHGIRATSAAVQHHADAHNGEVDWKLISDQPRFSTK